MNTSNKQEHDKTDSEQEFERTLERILAVKPIPNKKLVLKDQDKKVKQNQKPPREKVA